MTNLFSCIAFRAYHTSDRITHSKKFKRVQVLFLVLLFGINQVIVGEESDENLDEDSISIEELVVVGKQNSQPHEAIRSILGFELSILEIPRSASTISEELLDQFDIRDIDELITLSPGSFTQSFFGVAGSLDVRGTPGETYFRGVRRLDNPGNYPTPIGASDRVDVVRGPASPIYGPAKIGGYLNFVPKSARVEESVVTGYQTNRTVGLAIGSWDKQVLTGEMGGVIQVGMQDLGYYCYAEVENSGSFYRNHGTDQLLIQTSFDAIINKRTEVQFGGMFHAFTGSQNAGWNRLTQELIDDGVYITGQPLPLDVDGDGKISHQEFDLNGDGFTDLNPFIPGLKPGTLEAFHPGNIGSGVCGIGPLSVFGCFPEYLVLHNVGSILLDPSQVLIAPDDFLENDVLTLYFDFVHHPEAGGWRWTNQLFFETYSNLNESAYGFSQFHEAWVIENKLVGARSWRQGKTTIEVEVSPSLRFTDFEHGDDYTNEYFDRRDLSQPASALDTRLLATQIDDDYTEYYIGDYLDLGLASMVNIKRDDGWRVLAGIRHDSIAMESQQPVEKLLFASANNFCIPPDYSCVQTAATHRFNGFSWTLSLSYHLEPGLVPYVTVSRQSTVIAGQGAEITSSNIATGQAFDSSHLKEIGLKVSFLNNALYMAGSLYEQERTDFSAQSTVTNQASKTQGSEFEIRWVVNESLLLTFGSSDIEVINLNTLERGSRFSFVGAEDLPNVAPETFYGGALVGSVVRPGLSGARRAGIPRSIVSMTAIFELNSHLAVSSSVVDVDAVPSGFSNSVKLPAYTLVNVGMVLQMEQWRLVATVKNLSNERYFRSNFPNLFGSVIVLPELPRSYQLSLQYEW